MWPNCDTNFPITNSVKIISAVLELYACRKTNRHKEGLLPVLLLILLLCFFGPFSGYGLPIAGV